MGNQKTIKDFNYHFKGNLNTQIFLTSLIFVVPIFIALLALSMKYSVFGKIISMTILFTFLILYLKKFTSDNYILFDTQNIIHFKEKVLNEFSYSDLHKIEIYKPSKGLTQVSFRIKGNEFSVILETKTYSNFTYEQFAEFLLKQNSSIVVIEEDMCKKFRYTIENGEIKKTPI